MRNRRIWVKQFKTGKEVTIPIADKLYDALCEAEHWRCDQYVTPKCAARYNRTDANGVNIGNNLINLCNAPLPRSQRWFSRADCVSCKKSLNKYYIILDKSCIELSFF